MGRFASTLPDRDKPANSSLYLFQTFYDATSCEVVGRENKGNTVARDYADSVHPELVIESGHYYMAVVELHSPCAVGRWFYDLAFYPGFVLFCQSAVRLLLTT